MSRATTLYALQQIDSEIDARTQRLEELTAALGETEELVAARQRCQQAEEELGRIRTGQKDQELTVQSVNQKKRFSEQKLYGGKIRNPKELSDLQEEVTSLDRRKDALENELLETMLLAEAAVEELEDATRTLQQVASRWQDAQAGSQREIQEQEAKLKDLAARRQPLIVSLPPADLSDYDYLRERKGGVAVVLLAGSECQGCMTGVSAVKVREAKRSTPAHCGSCGRILCPE